MRAYSLFVVTHPLSDLAPRAKGVAESGSNPRRSSAEGGLPGGVSKITNYLPLVGVPTACGKDICYF